MKHVLIIDDEYDITRLLSRILEDAGYKTTVAEDGRKGIQRFRQDPADLVIADIFMPVAQKLGAHYILQKSIKTRSCCN